MAKSFSRCRWKILGHANCIVRYWCFVVIEIWGGWLWAVSEGKGSSVELGEVSSIISFSNCNNSLVKNIPGVDLSNF